jgi:hypothetical protein
MKLRIKGNTIRLRLTKSEVDFFEKENHIKEETDFGNSVFSYSLITDANAAVITAQLYDNTVTVTIPKANAIEWFTTNMVGLNAEMEIGSGRKLYILIEKDFKCLDETVEDQSDNYDNPLRI